MGIRKCRHMEVVVVRITILSLTHGFFVFLRCEHGIRISSETVDEAFDARRKTLIVVGFAHSVRAALAKGLLYLVAMIRVLFIRHDVGCSSRRSSVYVSVESLCDLW